MVMYINQFWKSVKKNYQNHIPIIYYPHSIIHYINYYKQRQQLRNNQHHNDSSSSVLPFTIVFRTFGSDVSEIAQLITNFAQGQHPDYPDVNCPQLCLTEDHLYQGRWRNKLNATSEGGKVVYQLYNTDETQLVASGDQEILQLLDQVSVCGIRDDYNYWKQNNWDPTCGKPIWVPYHHDAEDDATIPYDHHIIFDDNIHNLVHDGIVCVRRQQQDGNFVTVDGTTMHTTYQGINMIRVPTIEPVLNPNWFIEQINAAQVKLQQRLAKQQDEEEGKKQKHENVPKSLICTKKK